VIATEVAAGPVSTAVESPFESVRIADPSVMVPSTLRVDCAPGDAMTAGAVGTVCSVFPSPSGADLLISFEALLPVVEAC
jgi:hypothetical protein